MFPTPDQRRNEEQRESLRFRVKNDHAMKHNLSVRAPVTAANKNVGVDLTDDNLPLKAVSIFETDKSGYSDLPK